jgi:deoxycytidylate deaminase
MRRAKSEKKKSPSREKYEQRNPTVSALVPEETRAKLRAALSKLGMTLADALKVLAGELEVKTIPIDEAKKLGYEEAKKLYMVTYPCNICAKPIVITGPKAKEAASRFMVEHGWGHNECHEQAVRRLRTL